MTVNKRGAGILLHVSSLASPFGIGDLGPEAKAFVDFLDRSKQTYWQLLPLNPTEEGQGHSPYSSISSRAGNTLLISPELLVDEGLLEAEDTKQYYLPQEGTINYQEVLRVKTAIFDRAWDNFNKIKEGDFHTAFRDFCKREAYW